VERTLDRVLARLVAGDAVRRDPVAVGLRGGQEVEVLAHVELEAQLVPHSRAVGGDVAQHHVGVDVRQVADEDGGALAVTAGLALPAAGPVPPDELDVGCRCAPSGVGAVHDVVVDEGEGVEQLEGGTGIDDPRIVGVAARANEGPVAERGPQALAPGVDQVAQRPQRLDDRGVDGVPARDLAVEQAGQALVDARRHGAQARRRAGGRAGAHGQSHVTA
jgi:hypothetical protein